MTKSQDRNLFYLFFVCLVTALGGFLFGFDTAVISGTVERVKAQYGLSELLEGWFASSALVGCILARLGPAALRRAVGEAPLVC